MDNGQKADSVTVSEQDLLNELARQIKARGPSLANLAKAYVAAWAELDNVAKNAANPHFGSNYADLGAVLDTIKPVFAKYKLALLQAPAEINGDKLNLIGMLMHESGEMLTFCTQIPIGKATAQAVGSATSYGRRYQGAAIGGIAQVDDDGNAASEPAAPRKAPVKKEKAEEAPAQLGDLMSQLAACETLEAVEALKPAVKEANDISTSEAYLAKKKAMKAKVAA